MNHIKKNKNLLIICLLILVLDSIFNYLIFVIGSNSNAAYGFAYLWLIKTMTLCIILGILAIKIIIKFLKKKWSKLELIAGLGLILGTILLITYGIPIPRLIN